MVRPLPSIADNIRCKMAARRRIGFFDYHPLSEDMREARARAWRIWNRLQGRRMTKAES